MSNSTPSYTHARRKQNTHLNVPLCLCLFPWILKTTLIDWIKDNISTHMAIGLDHFKCHSVAFFSIVLACALFPTCQCNFANYFWNYLLNQNTEIRLDQTALAQFFWISLFPHTLFVLLRPSRPEWSIKYKDRNKEKAGRTHWANENNARCFEASNPSGRLAHTPPDTTADENMRYKRENQLLFLPW